MIVSVVTICKNNASGLEATLRSVTKQTWVKIDLIVIDGGSTDHSTEVIRQYEKNISYWVSEPDHGIYHAQNKGLKKVKGAYVIFLNAGDWFYNENTVENLLKKATTGREIIFGNLILQHTDKSMQPKNYPWPLPPHFFDYDTLPQCVTLIPTKLLRARGGLNEGLKICADFQFFREVVLAGQASIVHAPDALAVFNTEGISGLPENQQRIVAEREMVKKLEKKIFSRLRNRIDRMAARFNLWIPLW